MIKHKGKQYKLKSKAVEWNDVKDNQLQALRQAEKEVADIAKYFGYSEAVIQSRMKNIGLLNPWTPMQDRVLRDKYLKCTNVELARLVKSNTLYVRDRLDYLGLSRP